MSVVGGLIFGFSITSFLKTEDDGWYGEAKQKGNEQEKIATAYTILMGLACVFSAAGLITAVIRFWHLKYNIVTNPLELESMFGATHKIALVVQISIWGAVALFLAGLSLWSLVVHDGGLAWFSFALFLVAALLPSIYLLYVVSSCCNSNVGLMQRVYGKTNRQR